MTIMGIRSSKNVQQHVCKNPLSVNLSRWTWCLWTMNEFRVSLWCKTTWVQELAASWIRAKYSDENAYGEAKSVTAKNTWMEGCSHMHVECWNGKTMCSGCHQEMRESRAKINLWKKSAQKIFQTWKILWIGKSPLILVALSQTFKLYKVNTGEVLRNFVVPLSMSVRWIWGNAEIGSSWQGNDIHQLCAMGEQTLAVVYAWTFTRCGSDHPPRDTIYILNGDKSSLEEVRDMMMCIVWPSMSRCSIWCLYEIRRSSIQRNCTSPIGMMCGSCRLEEGQVKSNYWNMLNNMVYAIDVEQAEATSYGLR